MVVPNLPGSGSKPGYLAGRKPSPKDGTAEVQAGLWVTLVAAVVAVAALEQLTSLPWFATYPLALFAALLITAGYLQLKKFVARKFYK